MKRVSIFLLVIFLGALSEAATPIYFNPLPHFPAVMQLAGKILPRGRVYQMNSFSYAANDRARLCSAQGWGFVVADFAILRKMMISLKLQMNASGVCVPEIAIVSQGDEPPLGYSPLNIEALPKYTPAIEKLFAEVSKSKGPSARVVGISIYSPIDGIHFGDPVVLFAWQNQALRGVMIFTLETGKLDYDGP